MSNLLSVENLTMKFGGLTAIDDLSFDAKNNQITSIIGPNGAGKTTTLKMITGYLVPTEGKIEVNELNIIDDTHEIQKQIGYLPELNPLYTEMRVYEHFEFLAGIRNITGRPFKDALARVVEQCGLNGVIHKNISECSKGYKQRIGLASAMIHDPKILIILTAEMAYPNSGNFGKTKLL